jgi:CheY-like chemotaxis protein
MGTLAGGIAHDFNNILSAILGYGEMARKRAAEDATVSRYLDAALGAGLRAKSLVERILAFSRSGLGERMPVHIQSIVGEALTLQRASLPLGISLEVRLDAGDAAICGDPTQVHQVVMNLCANAVQAMGTTGRLEVAVDRVELGAARSVTTGRLPPGPYVRLVVRDSGGGIPPRVMERIFDPFFTTKEVGVGTGLGLSLVHGIVGDLGGGVDVDSDVGRGTTMTVYVPQTGEMTPAGAVEDSLPEGRGETVLIVDDEEGLVRLGEEMLGDLGYEPVGFASSLAALASFRSTPDRFDVVVTDESMPEMTGSELARQIRALRPGVPIVIMTGHATAELARRARELGVAEVLNKPLVARDMARGLASALQRTPGAQAGR